MSNMSQLINDLDKTEILENPSELVLNIKSSTLSERKKLSIQKVVVPRIRSEIQIESNVNYDDLCGPWKYSKNPVYAEYSEFPVPKLCVWKYFTEEDLIYLKKYQKDKTAIVSFFEKKFSNENGKTVEILGKMLWEFFKFMRNHSFTEKSVSAVLGIVYAIHTFLLSRPWWTAKQVYEFFRQAALLHVVLNPPKCHEIFTIDEINLLFEAFHELCMENLVLLHILYHPNCDLSLNL